MAARISHCTIEAVRTSNLPSGPMSGHYSGRAISSTKYALRWRALGRCESQQPGEQNTSLILPELQVETEQRITLAPVAIGLRHMEHTKAGVVVMSQIIYHVGEGSDYRSRVRVGTTTARATPAGQPSPT